VNTTATGRLAHLHPFPARMAPDVALQKIENLSSRKQRVLDPMCGSGTVPRLAFQEGRSAVATDLDPLAVMITTTACHPGWSDGLEARAKTVVAEASRLGVSLPGWMQDDVETYDFAAYWFAETQRAALSQLARVLVSRPRRDHPLRVALSRLIVTKEGGASLARDTSHSRPHRVRLENDYDVLEEFIASAARVERLVGEMPQQARSVVVRQTDARRLSFLPPQSIDLIVTSPPYLNAIDYLRGHRLSLIWLGSRLRELRDVRGASIGAEKSATGKLLHQAECWARESVAEYDDLTQRDAALVVRFTKDVHRLCRSMARVVKPDASLVLVMADSQLHGVKVSNSDVCKRAAARHGFELVDESIRTLPGNSRYLPPPETDKSTLRVRMKEESVLTFRRQRRTA
jgi:DNA modification methylase